jgi:hypothetical protein
LVKLAALISLLSGRALFGQEQGCVADEELGILKQRSMASVRVED